jgi:hypothetical protein
MQYENCPVGVIKRSGNIAAAVWIAMLLRRATMHCLSGNPVERPSLSLRWPCRRWRQRAEAAGTTAQRMPPFQVQAITLVLPRRWQHQKPMSQAAEPLPQRAQETRICPTSRPIYWGRMPMGQNGARRVWP